MNTYKNKNNINITYRNTKIINTNTNCSDTHNYQYIQVFITIYNIYIQIKAYSV